MPDPDAPRLSEEEFAAVSALPPGERYNHLVKRVADGQWIWILEDAGGIVGQESDDGRRFVPVWPHPRYAEACATDEWAGADPSAIEVHVWVEESLPGLAERGGFVSAFPTADDQGFVVPPLGMKADLEEELALFE